jgi:hypothetical protein
MLSVEGGPAIVTSRGGIGAATNVSLAARWHVDRHVEIGASMLLPTSDSEVTGHAGRAEIRLYSPAIEANVVAPTLAGFEVRGGLGVGTLTMTMRGVPAAAIFTAKQDSVTTGLGFARGSIGRSLGSRVRLWLDLRVAVAAPRPVVSFAGQQVASWGRPAMIGGLGVDVVLK